MKLFFTFLVFIASVLSASGQNAFPASGNALVAGYSYLNAGARVYMQYAGNAGNSWTRGILSQGIYWDNANAIWQVKGSSTTSDFSLIRFENPGHIGFFTRSTTGAAYTMTNAELEGHRKMIIMTNGNVGIGTASPQAKLAVNGNILAKEIKVKTDISVPDYVFEPDYKLLSLAEVENYIKTNKHLPEIPSAKEIGEEGLDLAAMNLALLKKMEELTLHLIAKEKELQVQGERLQRQEERISEIENLLNKIAKTSTY